jgi:hypothetical protein
MFVVVKNTLKVINNLGRTILYVIFWRKRHKGQIFVFRSNKAFKFGDISNYFVDFEGFS